MLGSDCKKITFNFFFYVIETHKRLKRNLTQYDKIHCVLLTFYAFGSCFRMLAVILLSDFVYYFSGGFKEKSKSVTCVKNSITLIDFDMLWFQFSICQMSVVASKSTIYPYSLNQWCEFEGEKRALAQVIFYTASTPVICVCVCVCVCVLLSITMESCMICFALAKLKPQHTKLNRFTHHMDNCLWDLALFPYIILFTIFCR